jgi:hypothetical protein
LLETRSLPSTVTNLSDHAPGSLRDAIATTQDGGTVDFQPGLSGVITLTTGELAINKDLTIEGPGADVITVSGNKASRVFNIANFTVAISGLTIADGMITNDFGGGIYNLGALTVTDCTFSGNSANVFAYNQFSTRGGGGIYNLGTLTVTGSTFSRNSASSGNVDGEGGGISNAGTLTLSGSTFSGNSAGIGGGISNAGTLTVTGSTFGGNSAFGAGAIYNFGGTLTISGSTFSGNTARFDGGISNAGTLTVTASTFSGNSASIGDGGGGIDNNGPLTVTACTFSGNSAEYGGGIYNLYLPGTMTVIDSTFSGNSAYGGDGGGIQNLDGTVTVIACTFSGNSAARFGGGISINGGTLTVTASTFSGNSAARSGGGIVDGGTLTVTASTFSGNSAYYGGGIYSISQLPTMRNTLLAGNLAKNGGPDVFGVLRSKGHNLIGHGSGGSGYAATDLVGIDPKLGPLQDNGGPTWTMALLPGSSAINAGGLTDSEWDQRGPGYARSVNGTTDIGAYEVQPSGAGAAALAHHSADLTHHEPVMAQSDPSTPSIPLRPAAAAVDRIFTSLSSDAVGLVAARPEHVAGTEPLCGAFDPLPV